VARRKPTALYFTSVVVLADDFPVLGGHLYAEGQEPSITRFLYFHEGKAFFMYDVPGIVYGVATKPKMAGKPRDTFCAMERTGTYREHVSGEKPVDVKLSSPDVIFLHDLQRIGKRLYACGTQNMVFRQEGDRWVRIDQGMFKPLKGRVTQNLASIDGFSEDDVYGVGMGGAIWRYHGKAWKKLKSPTNRNLRAVCCASSGDVVVAGAKGRVFRGGAKKGWTDLSDPGVQDDFIWDIAEFRGKVYLTAHDKLLVIDGGKLAEVKVPIRGASFMKLAANENQLWSVGDDCILKFDGKTWTRHVTADN